MPGTGTVRALSQAQLSGTAGAPEWVHLLPAGEALARDGRKFVLGNAEEVVTRFTQANVDLPIDYEHQADTRREDYTGPVPAAGWIKELAARADGAYGAASSGRAARPR